MKPKKLEFWESEKTKPKTVTPKDEIVEELEKLYKSSFSRLKREPFRSRDYIKDQQWRRIVYLVNEAFENVPFYHKLYRSVGFEPGDLKSWEDFFKLPIVQKEQLIEAGEDAINRKYDRSELFYTRSSGSSGKVLRIAVNKDAILMDTVQGIRQFWLQSDRKYRWNHLLAHIYTVPWWFSSIRGRYETAFISSLIETDKIVKILKDLNPHILSLYPSNLESLLEVSDNLSSRLFLTVVHSEMSSKIQRRRFAAKIGVPVLDEYSSEELTRIALELPCGHYHVHEDAVFLEVLDEESLKHCEDGESGLAVGTNLLNEAMPFIRYCQDDYIELPKKQDDCKINWYQIKRVEGRINDSFLRRDGKVVPAGTLLDASYRWMVDSGIQPYRFEMIQQSLDVITVNLQYGKKEKLDDAKIRSLEDKIRTHLNILLGSRCHVNINVFDKLPDIKGKKHMPIRREF